ncbi:pentatricopeptide repeat-containing protein At1g62260, mitochondrial [Abrus precatorius]|uniref:Pentatricopeptide repeat-containing protein At1g62260, mitochondrial n=1 Tax=Abrus precatorius TaxID=3816 RepID=A0A8B8KSC6_ABRPR|nr:pentatricopeptide repeat-containing protein At1g62260, mitochondrial [Abrus precatorius]XP_027346797.1 pentatricopeptide repeat-containing protein At1g62260, mitochondrial [Abrus precatorius]
MGTLYGILTKLRMSNAFQLPRIHCCRRLTSVTDLYNSSQILLQSNKMISLLIRDGRFSEARALFDSMKHRNTVTWNSMISGYVKRREIAKARKLFDQMPQKDIVSWNLIVSGYFSCSGRRFVEEGRNLFDQMPQRDCVSWNTVISGYAKNGKMDQALKLFNDMPQPNVVSSNAVISGFLLNGDVDSAVGFFKMMPERDSASLSALISGLVRNGELDMAASILLECGNEDDEKDDLVYAYNTLIAGYGQRGEVDEARRIFDGIPNGQGDGKEGRRRFRRNVVSWNSMMMCYVKAGDILSARELFDRMMERDTCSWNTMISGYIQISDMEEASKLFRKMPSPDALSWNSIISGFAQIGDLKLAKDFFERMPYKNLISWNSIIAGYEKNEDYKGAIKLFSQMQLEGERPDRHTLSSVLSVCTGLVDLYLGKQIHQLVTKTVLPDSPINNSLITMYSRCGAIVDACTVFNEIKLYKDVITWNAMIGGYASHGLAEEALELFKLMKRLKIHPTYITFISVLNACAHVGLVEEGRRQFESMINDYSIEPRVEHFASLVDILGRQGQLQEAMDLIKTMPFKPDKAVWGALLGACRIHNEVELAQVAAEALISLEPASSAPYVLLYNMYANLEQWDDAERVRVLMEEKNVKKQAGYSWVDS